MFVMGKNHFHAQTTITFKPHRHVTQASMARNSLSSF